MKILEIVLLLLTAVATALSFVFISTGIAAFFIMIFVLSMFYFIMGFAFFSNVRARNIFKNGFSNVPEFVITMSVVTGIFAAIAVNAVMFKLLVLPGGTEMLNIGLVGTFIWMLIQLILFLRRRDGASKLSLSRLAMLFVVSLILYMTPSLTIVRARYRDHPRYVEAFVKFEANRNATTLQALQVEEQRVNLTAEEFERKFGDKK